MTTDRLTLRAPFGATLFRRFVVPGEPVEHGQQSRSPNHEHKSSPVAVMDLLTVRPVPVDFERR
jgi:hypothetical protein